MSLTIGILIIISILIIAVLAILLVNILMYHNKMMAVAISSFATETYKHARDHFIYVDARSGEKRVILRSEKPFLGSLFKEKNIPNRNNETVFVVTNNYHCRQEADGTWTATIYTKTAGVYYIGLGRSRDLPRVHISIAPITTGPNGGSSGGGPRLPQTV